MTDKGSLMMKKLLIGGSPCTHWSIAQTKDRETEPKGLGWDLFENFLIALKKFQPDFFLYENNKSMSPAIRAEITKRFGFEPICINSAKVSAQNRQRLYWAGKRNPDGTYSRVDVQQPEDLGILLRDILESGVCWREKGYTLKANYTNAGAVNGVDGGHFPAPMAAEPVNVTADGKAQCLRATCYKDGIRNMVGNSVDRRTCVAEPIRIGTIEREAKNQDFDSQQYRVYSPERKSVTLCGHGGGVGAKTGLYATPIRVCTMSTHQGDRIYSCDGKSCAIKAERGGLGGNGQGLYAVPCAGRIVGRRINEKGHRDDYNEEIQRIQRFELNENPYKTNCLSTVEKDNMIIENANGKNMPVYEVRDGIITIKGTKYEIKLPDGFYIIRKLTVLECMRLQTVPEWYVFPVSNTQAYKMLGNGWTVDVIAHIMSHFEGLTAGPLDVLSMYDGMACGHIALDKLGAQIFRYRATEIDKYAIKTACHNFHDIEQLGDAFQVREW